MSTSAKVLAEELNGISYREIDISHELHDKAKSLGLVIVTGASDDLLELYGAIYDEGYVYDGGKVLLNKNGLLGSRDDLDTDEQLEKWLEDKKNSSEIEALWCDEGNFSWTYKTNVPHETFIMYDEGEEYCRGLVIDINDLGK